MVSFHPTCDHYSIPGVQENDHKEVIRKALEHARELIDAGYESVRGGKLEDAIVRSLSERYFGSYTTVKHDKVRGQ